MRPGPIIGVILAVLLHAAFILFGGLIFNSDKDDKGTLAKVDLLSESEAEKPKEEKPQEQKELQPEETPPEEAPDAEEIIRNMDTMPSNDAPALEAASLGAIEAALSGAGGAGDFADALSFSTGGRIGGTGTSAGGLQEEQEDAFSLGDLDQKPRALVTVDPVYPAELRNRRLEGVVFVIFVVEPDGRVGNMRIEKSPDPAFNKPALDALKQWKFEPGVRGGKRVASKMRQPFRFKPAVVPANQGTNKATS